VTPTPPKVQALRDKPHGPARTWGKRLSGPFHVTGVFWYRLGGVAARMPDWFLSVAVFVHTWFFWLLLRGIRDAVATNLEVVMGPCGWWARQRRIWRTFNDYAWCFVERYQQFVPQKKMHFDFCGAATYEKMVDTDRGFVFFTAHFGNWEMGPLTDKLPGGRKFHIVREPEMSQAAQTYVQELFEQHPQRDQFVVHYAGAELTLGARLLMALRKGDVVGMPGDRPRAGMATIKAEMFGRPMELPPGPVALARAAGAMMVPVFVFREGRRHYRIELWDPVDVANTDDKTADIEAGVAAMSAACERAIRQRPHHWFCWKKLWQ
jgi:lauroyl/myristoyl acyltransferase